MQSIAESRHASRVDPINHGGVQPWSAGPIFPAVLMRVERYETFAALDEFYAGQSAGYPGQYEKFAAEFYALPLEQRLQSVSWMLMLDGEDDEYASYDDAYEVAVAMLASPERRADRKRVLSDERLCDEQLAVRP